MARRLCLDERARIEAMAQAGFGAGEIAVRLGRHRSTVHREVARGGGPQQYGAGDAQQSAGPSHRPSTSRSPARSTPMATYTGRLATCASRTLTTIASIKSTG